MESMAPEPVEQFKKAVQADVPGRVTDVGTRGADSPAGPPSNGWS